MARKTVRSADRTGGPLASGSRADLTALSLLSAAGFTVDLSGEALNWLDDDLIANLLSSPLKRIPRNQQAFDTLISAQDRVRRAGLIAGLHYDDAAYDLQYQVQTFAGHVIWVQERGRRMSGEGTSPAIITGVLTDITTLKRAEMASNFAASHDPLTRLWNRERFCEALTYEGSAASLREEPGFLACIQISGLENINAAYGTQRGDEVLRRIAEYLKSSAQAPRQAARITGASFGLLCPGLKEPEARQYLKNMCDWISGQNFTETLNISLSVAMQALNAVNADSSKQLGVIMSQLAASDSFFAPAKNRPSIIERSQNITADDILAALQDQRFSLAYQPIIEAKTRRPHHYECLLRLSGEDGTQETAGPMIMAAETLGYIHLLDRRALNIGAEILKAQPDLHLAFNVSAGTIRNRFAAESYIAALREMGADAQRVTIELTETLALKDPDEAGKFAQKARELGCRFAIDDFGSGHTTFQNLMTIEADMIKIDGSMIKNLSDMPLKETFVRIMVDFANTFGVEIVAEMINSEADADRLQTLGVDYFQGYMFGKPAPEPDLGLGVSSGQSQARR